MDTSNRLKQMIKSAIAATGYFVGRQFKGRITGHELTRDLRLLIGQSEPLCLDVGANKGQTIALLQRCFSRPTIHAFEPASDPFSLLSSQSLGPNTHLYPLALGAARGSAEFRHYKQSELSSFLPVNPDRGENLFAEEPLVAIETVPVDTLDHFCQEQDIASIDLLKIDTQGFEMPVLQGGLELLRQRRIGAVLLELNFSLLYEGQSDPLAIIQLLREHDLRLVDFYEKERVGGHALSWTTALFVRHH
ncbi:hypothetical protein GCM10027578_10180 [Spirosoma luteolum]